MDDILSLEAGYGGARTPRWLLRQEILVGELMQARRAKGEAMRKGDEPGRQAARKRVDEAKHRLGERGSVWWTDGAPDWNRHMTVNTPYATWFNHLSG